MENITLKIDQETQDLVLDDSGSLELIGDAGVTVIWVGEHGVRYYASGRPSRASGSWTQTTAPTTTKSSRTATATLKPSSARRSSRRPMCNTSTA